MKSIGVATGCGCKEVYRFPYLSVFLLYLFFFAAASLLFVNLKKCFSFLFKYFFVITLYVLNNFSRSINTHTGNYGHPTAAIWRLHILFYT